MNIYDIDREIESVYLNAIDPETGEISAEAVERLDALNMERAQKVENVALWHKNSVAESKAIADEIKALQERKKAIDSKIEWQKEYLNHALNGERFETARVAVSYRKSEAVEIYDEKLFLGRYADDPDIVTVSYKVNKSAVKKYLKSGSLFCGATLVERQNIQIK